MQRKILKPFWILIALIFAFEAWLWDIAQPPIAWVVRQIPWQQFKTALARGVSKLPPAIVVFIFILPDAILTPVKIFALWMVARGLIISGTVLFILAKASGLITALVLFEICREKLMELGWFRWTYGQIMRARNWARGQIQPFLDEFTIVRNHLKAKLAGILRKQGFFELLRRVRNTVQYKERK